jgi:integrase/recombinase XerD
MEQVTLKPLRHKEQDCIGIYFTNNAAINGAIRKYAGAKWSATHKVWYTLLTKENYTKLSTALKGKATINNSALYQHLTNKKQQAVPPVITAVSKPAAVKAANSSGKKITIPKPGNIDAVNKHVIPAMQQMLQLKAYSSSTMRTYLGEMTQLLILLKNNPADVLTTADLKRYLAHCFEKLKLTENTLHSRTNALKFYYEQVLKKEKLFWEIPRPKKQQQNPHFFNQDEITQILKLTDNLKHKTMLMLAYSTGMRISEVTTLKVWQIDSKRMQIIVEQAKGKKDRMTPLSPVLLVMLREYFTVYKPLKTGYLFCGQQPTEPYSTRSLQLVLQAAKKRAGILKPGSVHALRHSFATHLLDKGTDVTMIMKLLGHNDIKTTLRYLHVTNRDVLNIISPLDQLNLD